MSGELGRHERLCLNCDSMSAALPGFCKRHAQLKSSRSHCDQWTPAPRIGADEFTNALEAWKVADLAAKAAWDELKRLDGEITRVQKEWAEARALTDETGDALRRAHEALSRANQERAGQ